MSALQLSERPSLDSSRIVCCVAYRNGVRLRELELDAIPDTLHQPDVLVWLGLHEPDESLMRRVQALFDLHDLAVEDAYRAHQRPKLEIYGEGLFVVLHTVQLVGNAPAFGETHIFAGPGYLLTVRHGASSPYTPVRDRCSELPELLKLGPGLPLYALMDYVVDHYAPLVHHFEDRLQSLEESMFKGRLDRDAAEAIYDLKSEVMKLRRAVVPVADICGSLVEHAALIPAPLHLHFRDVRDHALRISDAIDAQREMLSTVLAVNLSLTQLKQNEVMKRLAGWGAILAIPTMVGGIYGMNFDHMPELHWRYGYPAVLGVVLLGCVLVYRRLKQAGWL